MKLNLMKKASSILITIVLVATMTSASTIQSPFHSQEKKASSIPWPQAVESNAFILTTDYLDSSISIIDLEDVNTVQTDIHSTHGDDQVRYYNGHVYVLNRWGYDLIEVFDVNNNFEKTMEFSTGAGSNPQDIVFISDEKAYVSCYDSTDLLIVNPQNGNHIGAIDLSEYADDDGYPEMHKMIEFKFFGKSRVYLTVQRLDRHNMYEPTDLSYVIEFDSDADTILNVIPLTGVNPTTEPILDGLHIIIGESGSWFDDTDGGIDRVHLFSNEAEGFLLTEADLEGNILDFDIYPTYTGLRGLFWSYLEQILGLPLKQRFINIITSDLSYNTHLHSYNIKQDTLTLLLSSEGYQFTDIATTDAGLCLLSDRTPTAPGIRLFDVTEEIQLTCSPLDVGAVSYTHLRAHET